MAHKHDNAIQATLTALADQIRGRGAIAPLSPSTRLDGKTALVTGANSGLGFGVSVQLARRGARVLMVCRSGIPEAGEAVRRASGSDRIEMLPVDLTDFASIHALADTLRDRGEKLDIVVNNAGLMPRESRETRDGFELMFAVNFLAKVVLLERLLGDGVIPNGVFADAAPEGAAPRIVLVASEAHRSAPQIDWSRFGAPIRYGLADGMKWYGWSKLLLIAYGKELARRLTVDGVPQVAVHSLCPGPVNSNMAREAPRWAKPILVPVMKLFFNAPEEAAEPVLYLAASPALEGKTGTYLHMFTEKDPRRDAMDPAVGEKLWDAAHELLRGVGALRG